jgi:hypothetical protein
MLAVRGGLLFGTAEEDSVQLLVVLGFVPDAKPPFA